MAPVMSELVSFHHFQNKKKKKKKKNKKKGLDG